MYLAHHELESVNIVIVIMITKLSSLASCRGSLQLLDRLSAALQPTTTYG
jgi:hypothetical protein